MIEMETVMLTEEQLAPNCPFLEHTFTYERHTLKYFKSIRRGSEFAFDVLTTGWSRVPVNEYRFCLKTKRYRGERPEITFKLRVLEYRFQILWLLTTM